VFGNLTEFGLLASRLPFFISMVHLVALKVLYGLEETLAVASLDFFDNFFGVEASLNLFIPLRLLREPPVNVTDVLFFEFAAKRQALTLLVALLAIA